MSLEVLPFEPWHLEMMEAQGVQGAQLNEVSHVPVAYAKLLRPAGPCFSAWHGGTIVVSGGIVLSNSHIGLVWAVMAASAGDHMLALHRAAARFLSMHTGVRRLEATVEQGFEAGCRWITLLGFEFEGLMRGYGSKGETHERYARVI